LLNELKLKLQDEKFINKNRLSLKSFVRQRILTFDVLVSFLLQKTNQSYQVCFKRLNLLIAKTFYSNTSYRKWKGHRVLSVDGSTLLLPDHHSLEVKFSNHGFGVKANVKHCMSRISYLYDCFNGLVIDAQMESFNTSEAHLCKTHLPFIKKGDLVIFDRYYASYELMGVLLGKGVDFLFRMKTSSWNCVIDFMESEDKERVVSLKLPKKCKPYIEAYDSLGEHITFRLIKKESRNGEVKVFACSLIDEEKYNRKSIINLYKERWGIEEAYKLIKSRLEVADFSGKTLEAVQQDFYAKTTLLSLSAVLRFKIKPNKKGRQSRKKAHTQKRVPMINRTFSLYSTKKVIQQLHWTLCDDFSQMIDEFIYRIQNKVEHSRKGQTQKRKIKKHVSNIHPMSYKIV